ncbi:dephospho-CoA kinase [Leucobacter sp. cx-42]|uniref:dephospho-CoA kinase n=1 Tax=unclassified Leucobacter TaxID=2621730 RepID=UPI00165DA932|nr:MULTISPECIES: dephospho-CoA kinase [unclassified Leucobacter]MBC9954634.1 dephospho-CoA kinase [Leucobacter sp. cx-42]
MTLIALTGGIASGKSTVSARFAELGAVVIDADQLAREAVAPGTPGLAGIVQAFGADVLDSASGELNRAALGARVFGDAEALATLNGIVHPEVRRLAAERIDAAREADPHAVIVYEIPLLVESGHGLGGAGSPQQWDVIVVADAPAEVRLDRLRDLRGLSEEEAQRRIASQATDEDRRAIADILIHTAESLDATRAQVDAIWQSLGE